MKKKNIWMAVVTDENEVAFSKACQSKQKAQTVIVNYLQKNKEFDGKDFGEACFWIGENDLRLDLMVFEMQDRDFSDIRHHRGLLIDPPPKELGLYRVVYVIDIGAGDVIEAAKNAYKMMSDSDSMPPVVEVIDGNGNKTKIDLSERKG